MKAKDIRKKTEDECLKDIDKMEKRIKEIKFSSAISKVKNTKEAINLRRDVARIKTILNEKRYEK